MNLAEDKKQKIADALMNVPSHMREQAIQEMQSRGIDFDVYEHTPIRLTDELRQMTETAKEAATFGLVEGRNIPNAGDFEVFGQEVRPADIGGEIIGAAPGLMLGYGAAGMAGRAAGLTGRALAATRVAGGEALPGFLNGLIRSDGDVEEAMKTAAEWAALGMVGEGVARGVASGLRKWSQGKSMSRPEWASVERFGETMKNMRDRTVEGVAHAGEGISDYLNVTYGRAVADISAAAAAGKSTKAEWLSKLRSGFEGHMQKASNWSEDAIFDVADRFEEFADAYWPQIQSGNVSAKQVRERFGKFFSDIENAYGDWKEAAQGFARDVRQNYNDIDFGPDFDFLADADGFIKDMRFATGRAMGTAAEKAPQAAKDVRDRVAGFAASARSKAARGADWAKNEGADEAINFSADTIDRVSAFAENLQSSPVLNDIRETARMLMGDDPLGEYKKNMKFALESAKDFLGQALRALPGGKKIVGDAKQAGMPIGRYLQSIRGGQKVLDDLGVLVDQDGNLVGHADTAGRINRATKPDYSDSFQKDRIGTWAVASPGQAEYSVRGVVEEISDVSISIRSADGELIEIPKSHIDGFVEFRGGQGRGSSGGSQADAPRRPVSDELANEYSRVRSQFYEYTGKGGGGDHVQYAKMLDADVARKQIADMRFKLSEIKNKQRQRIFDSIDNDSGPSGVMDERAATGMADDLTQDTWLGRLAKLAPTYARHGLSANPGTAREVRRMLHQYEEWGKRTSDLLTEYRAALEPLGMSMKDRMSAVLPGSRGSQARAKVHEVNRKKILLARALDGDDWQQILRDNPDLVEPHRAIRRIFDDLAEELDLPKGQRITHYFPHIFNGSLGQYFTKELAQELGERGRFLVSEEGIPLERHFQNLKDRKGAEGFDLDLDAAMYAYIRGAVKKKGMDEFLERSERLLKQMPARNAKGGKHVTREMFRDYVRYISGQPGAGRRAVAQFWQDSALFNNAMDSLIGFLGNDPDAARWIARARQGALKPDGTRNKYDDAARVEALKFFRKLVNDANQYTAEGVLKDGVSTTRRTRARMALKVDEIRRAMQDPNAAPVIISRLYGLMVVNKLGLNISHGLINMTQTMTNTMPMIGLKKTVHAMKLYAGPKDRRLPGGKTVQRVLDDLGVEADTPEAMEFVQTGIGWRQEVMDSVVMAPARITERFNRSVAGLGAYEKAIEEGLSHADAIVKARDLVLKTQFPFNKAGVSPIMHSPMARFLLMFKSYPMHQINFSMELLEDAVKKGDRQSIEAFSKHMLSYVMMAGMGATALGGTSFGWKAQHPAMDFTQINGAESAVETLGGPPSSALLELLHGQVMSAAREVAVPAALHRASDGMQSMPDHPGRGVLQMMGMAP